MSLSNPDQVKWLQEIDRVVPKRPVEVQDALRTVGFLVSDRVVSNWVDLTSSPPDVHLYLLTSSGALHRLKWRTAAEGDPGETFTSVCSHASTVLRSDDRYDFRVERRVLPNKETLVTQWTFQIGSLDPIRMSVDRDDEQTRPAGRFASALAQLIERARNPGSSMGR